MCTYAQVAYIQYRHVPADKEAEFIELETKYWSQVAKAAIEKGDMLGWSLWRKVGVTDPEAPNYVFVNNYESAEKADPSKVWTEENLAKMGKSPDQINTNSFTTVPFDCWMKLEAMIQGEYKYALVNYAKPESRTGFIEENKELWMPLHQKNIDNKTNGMTSWGLMSTIIPGGKNAKFSCLTWDGFNTMADVLNYMSYQSPSPNSSGPWAEVMEKTKMSEIMPDGFEYSIVYELVMRL